MVKNFFNWLLQMIVPYGLLVAGFMLLKLQRGQDKFEKAFDIGYDSCILGLGIAAVLLGSSEFEAVLQTNNVVVAPLIIGIITLVGFAALERSQKRKVTKARASILVGTLIFGVNTAIITWLDQRAVFPAVFWGAVCFVLPCLSFWLVIGTQLPKNSPAANS
jgi:hypothetical protein